MDADKIAELNARFAKYVPKDDVMRLPCYFIPVLILWSIIIVTIYYHDNFELPEFEKESFYSVISESSFSGIVTSHCVSELSDFFDNPTFANRNILLACHKKVLDSRREDKIQEMKEMSSRSK